MKHLNTEINMQFTKMKYAVTKMKNAIVEMKNDQFLFFCGNQAQVSRFLCESRLRVIGVEHAITDIEICDYPLLFFVFFL